MSATEDCSASAVTEEADRSTRVVETVSSATGIPILDLPPLSDAIDPDVVDHLLTQSSTTTVEFVYADTLVTIDADGSIDVEQSA